jgi:hypothetical protein
MDVSRDFLLECFWQYFLERSSDSGSQTPLVSRIEIRLVCSGRCGGAATMARVSAMESDYDSDHDWWGAWRTPRDVHTVLAAELRGPILDVT